MFRRALLPIMAILIGGMVLGSPQSAEAAQVLAFGQTSNANTVTGTNNGAGSTTITATDVQVIITQFQGGGAPIVAFLDLTATSVGSATVDPNTGNVVQNFNGTWSITNAAGTTNYLSGSFVDGVFGSGEGLTLLASSATPGETVTFTSDFAISMDDPRTISLSFSNVQPDVHISNGSLGSFTASVTGTFSAEDGQAVPEPATLVMLGMCAPVLGVGGLVRRYRRKSN